MYKDRGSSAFRLPLLTGAQTEDVFVDIVAGAVAGGIWGLSSGVNLIPHEVTLGGALVTSVLSGAIVLYDTYHTRAGGNGCG